MRAESELEPTPDVPGYTLGDRIGAGGFGQVYSARHDGMGRDVAIKVLHARFSANSDAVARFVSEVRAVSRLSHVGVVQIFDFGVLADRRPYCVMERVRGKTLREVLRDRTRLPLAEALPILRAMAEAIDAVHAAGIAHRDLKPENVFLCDGGGVKLIDFGLAKLVHAEAPVTETGTVFGTPLYMSPEQCRGKASDPRTDAYSFGALAYHVLVGEPPFSGDALELALHHLHDAPVPPSQRRDGLGDRVDRVVLALLAKDPAVRPMPVAKAIAAIDGGAALPRRRGRRWPWIAAASAVAALAVIGTVAARGASAPADDCASGAARVAEHWGEPQRHALAFRFASAGRADVAGTWQSIQRQLDAYATRWTHDWDTACHARDRATDPLLYAQRITCLENALIDLHGAVTPLLHDDPAHIALAYPGSIIRLENLASCASTDVLRAQVPAPPPDQRAAVAALTATLDNLEVQRRAISDVRDGGNIAALLARYRTVIAGFEELHSPLAANAAYDAALLSCALARAQPEQREAARQALADAAERARRYRNDACLARVEICRIEIETDAYGSPDAIADALARGEAAVARAGHPAWLVIELAVQHARFDAQHGRLSDAIARLDDVVATYPVERRPFANDHTSPDLYRPQMLARAGRVADALAAQRDNVARVEAEVGPIQHHAVEVHAALAQLEAFVGDEGAALAEIDRVLALLARLDTASFTGFRTGTNVARLELAARAGRDDIVRDALRALEPAPPDLPAEALASGELSALSYLLERRADPSDVPLRAELAFARDPAHAPAPDRPGAVALALGMRGDWHAAQARLDGVSADPKLPMWQRGELAAVRGIAMLELGDAQGAIDPLEQSLALAYDCCDGFHGYVPQTELALARALWDTGGDRSRARWLVMRARDQLGWLGPVRAADRARASAWLDAHPP